MKSCSIEGCLLNYYSVGFCKKHYDKKRRNGEATFERKILRGTPCSIASCEKPVWMNKMCAMHDRRTKRHGDPNYINPKCNRDGKAQVRNHARVKQWKQDNWHSYKCYLAARKARVKRATPSWVDLAAIEKIYRGCPKGFHVDHIVPINGKDRSGLHVPWNLQYLPALENLRKSNKIVL